MREGKSGDVMRMDVMRGDVMRRRYDESGGNEGVKRGGCDAGSV